MNQPSTSSRLPSLDGWRAVSILMVIGFHTGFIAPVSARHWLTWLFDGGLGVRFFFVISGFLITWLLILEMKRTGHIGLKHFYLRRGLRILPVYCAFLMALFGFQLLSSFNEHGATWLALLTFTRNYVDGTQTSGHFWSLSVEEQFYLVWPAIFLSLGGGRNLKTSSLALALPVLSAPAFRALGYLAAHDQTRLFGNYSLHSDALKILFSDVSFFCQYDSLALGCFCGVLLAHKKEAITSLADRHAMLMICTGGLLILAPGMLARWFLPPFIRVPFEYTLQAAGFSMLMLQSVIRPDWGFYRILNWKCVAWVGTLSYSLYIWQQIFWTQPWALPGTLTPSWWICGWVVPALATAAFSYYALERPLLKLRSRFRDA